MLSLVLMLAIAQPPQAPSPLPAQAPPVKICECFDGGICQCGSNCKCDVLRVKKEPTYAEMRAEAIRTGKPLAVFIHQPAREIPGMLSVRSATMNFDDGPIPFGVVIGRPVGNDLRYVATLAIDASNDEIAKAAKGVSPMAVPFARPSVSIQLPMPALSPEYSKAGQEAADADSDTEGSPWLSRKEQRRIRRMWPTNIEFPEGLKFYKKSEWSQYLASDVGSGEFILPFHTSQDQHFGNDQPAMNPNRVKPHWTAPGGLQNIPRSEWRSYVGAAITGKIGFWHGRTRVPNAPNGSLGKKQWEFHPGTTFVDMLTNAKGEPFEIRMREKMEAEEGKPRRWASFVAWKEPDARPAGYTSAKQLTGKRCADCHETADHDDGSLYFINLRGGDGTRSFPVMDEGTLRPNMNLPVKVWN